MLPVSKCCILYLLLTIARVAPSSSFAAASAPTAATTTSTPSVLAGKTVCIAGGGPCGLFLAILLLEQEETVQVHILEKLPARDNRGRPSNTFGMGLSPRLLSQITPEELKSRLRSVGAKVNQLPPSFGGIASRQDICEQMVQYLEEHHGRTQNNNNNTRFQISFDEACQEVDLDQKTIRTSQGRVLSYDLLVAADGVNSKVRRQLVEQRGLQEEHYLQAKSWKALRMPPQPDLDPGSFKPLIHPTLGGRILPRNPNGHIALVFFDDVDGTGNPQGVQTVDDLTRVITESLSDRKKGKRNSFISNLFGVGGDKREVKPDRQVLFDNQAVEEFLKARAGRSHYMKVDRFHESNGSVALLGDAAHGMYTFLGQGCACGLLGARILAECLQKPVSPSSDLQSSLEQYSERAVPEAHAITDLNLVGHILSSKNMLYKLLCVPTLIWQTVRGKVLIRRVSDGDGSYNQILKENRFVVALGRRLWKKQRVPLPNEMG